MSASRCIPGPSVLVSASSCPASGRACPGETTGPVGRRWRCRSRWVRWNAAPWRSTNWPREVQGDRLGTGPSTPGDPRPQAGRRDPGQHPGLSRQQAIALSRHAGRTAGGRGGRPPGTVSDHANPRLAHLPFQRTLEQFDFGFQPSVDERLVKELANLAFVPKATNILLLGPPGVGKTHLAIALALRAIENGFGAYFVRAYDLMEDLRKARNEHNLDRRMKVYLAPKVLVVDEFGILALRPGVGHRLLHLGVGQVRARQHHPDVQQGLRRVGRAPGGHRHRLGCPGPVAAPQPCAEHTGESFRLREKRQAGLFPSHQHLAASPKGMRRPLLLYSLP